MDILPVREHLKELISKQLNTAISSMRLDAVGGGSINESYRVTINTGQQFFLKLNSKTKFPGLFEKEKNGLDFLASQHCIKTPPVIFSATADNYQLLLLKWIDGGIRNAAFWEIFGEQLARLHSINDRHFGFVEDNYMGSLPQSNEPSPDWPAFFARCRLQPQIEMATARHLLQKTHRAAFDSLLPKLSSVFDASKPSLLDGDLWSGNFMCDEQSLPVLIDPAVYFGHRSMDLAMTTLFGGFDRKFYESYNYHFPLPSNYHEQWQICNLYPLLIHLNLFGSSYLHQITDTLNKFK
jgi:protein-ribulosamine 3-kinase